MKRQPDGEPESGGAPSPAGSGLARILAILGVNLVLVLVVVVYASTDRGRLPDLNASTLGVGLLPVSAAMGLLLACRRLDLSLPAVLALAIGLRTNPHIFHEDPAVRLAIFCGICAGIGLVSAVVTWFGRISSALWTAILAIGVWALARELHSLLAASGGWPWPMGLTASLGLMVVGAAVLGAVGLVQLPSTPPIIRSGSRGLAGLACAWALAGIGLALGSQSEAARPMADQALTAYPPVLAAAALGGAYILRGRWGAAVAIVTTVLGHLVWSFAIQTDLGSPLVNLAVPLAAPLVAIPLYLVVDRMIRRSTSESAPTALLG